MKKKTLLKKLALLAAVTTVTVSTLLTGCKNSSNDTDKAAENTKVQDVVVATGGMPKPFSYQDDNGNLAGYDIEVVKAIFSKLPQYNQTFEVTDFTSIFAGLDSDRYQIGANNFAYNEERNEKYIYTDPIFANQFVIAVPSDNTDINSFEDLLGKTTEVSVGLNYATALENYNKEHADNPVKLSYSENDLAVVLQSVQDGKYDFQLIDKTTLEQYNKEYGLTLKAIDLTEEETQLIGAPYSYLLVARGDLGEQLAADINEVLAQLIADGTISEISEKYFGGDYAPH